MKRYSVLITPGAEADTQSAYLYIAADSPEAAKKWREGLLLAAETLATMPNRCPLSDECEGAPFEVRQLVHGNYLLLFRVREDVVEILHVRHSARHRLGDELA